MERLRVNDPGHNGVAQCLVHCAKRRRGQCTGLLTVEGEVFCDPARFVQQVSEFGGDSVYVLDASLIGVKIWRGGGGKVAIGWPQSGRDFEACCLCEEGEEAADARDLVA